MRLRSTRLGLWMALLVCVGTALVWGQRFRDNRFRGGWGGRGSAWGPDVRTARSIPNHSTETPNWTNAPSFERDVFTFARVIYGSGGRSRYGRGGWTTDLPDSDLNLSYRLQQMTSMKVDPDGRLIALTDPDLADYPFIYIVEPGSLRLSEPEIQALRDYLENGGFLMLDDFWGENEWANCEEVMRAVLPNRSFEELPLEHPLYRCVFRIEGKHQLPNVETGIQSQWSGVTWERPDAKEVHHRAIFDDEERLMVIAFHNTDNGDGWEWEGHDNYYFRNFSEKIAYPLAINTLFYVMTH